MKHPDYKRRLSSFHASQSFRFVLFRFILYFDFRYPSTSKTQSNEHISVAHHQLKGMTQWFSTSFVLFSSVVSSLSFHVSLFLCRQLMNTDDDDDDGASKVCSRGVNELDGDRSQGKYYHEVSLVMSSFGSLVSHALQKERGQRQACKQSMRDKNHKQDSHLKKPETQEEETRSHGSTKRRVVDA
jgi:hypothetical protein